MHSEKYNRISWNERRKRGRDWEREGGVRCEAWIEIATLLIAHHIYPPYIYLGEKTMNYSAILNGYWFTMLQSLCQSGKLYTCAMYIVHHYKYLEQSIELEQWGLNISFSEHFRELFIWKNEYGIQSIFSFAIHVFKWPISKKRNIKFTSNKANQDTIT